MSEEEFWAVIRNHFLMTRVPGSNGSVILCRTSDGLTVSITNPNKIRFEDRHSELCNIADRFGLSHPTRPC